MTALRRGAISVLLAGCGAADLAEDVGGGPLSPGGTDLLVPIRVDVLPSQLRASNDADAPYRALPQTFPQPPLGGRDPIDLGDLPLASPVVQQGSVEAFRTNPIVASFPGEQVPVAGLVRIQKAGSLQSYAVLTDAAGGFSMWAVPGPGYRLQIVPDDPLLPFTSTVLDVLDPPTRTDLDLGVGAPIYGRMTIGTSRLPSAAVRVIDEWGVSSAPAFSDEEGLYQIRVAEGTWTLVFEGRDARDPTLVLPDLEVDADGLALDIALPAFTRAQIAGIVQDADGQPASGGTVRIVSESLDGFEGLDASWTTDEPVNGDGLYNSSVVPGTYTLEFLPASEGRGSELTPLRLTGVHLGGEYTEMPKIQLGHLVEVSGTIAGPNGVGLASAHVLCHEEGFDQRTFDVFTADRGTYALEVPAVPLACEASPPAARGNLASSRFWADPTTGASLGVVQLASGTNVRGRVVLDGVPEPYAVVEIRDDHAQLLGSGLTGEDGTFTVPVDLERDEP